MTLIDYFNQFWREDDKKHFSPAETRLYFHLLRVWNSTGRKEWFECKTSIIESVLEMNRMTITRSRDKLKSRGLLKFKQGVTKGKYPYYFLCRVTDDVTDNVTDNVTENVTDNVTLHRVNRDKEINILSTHAHTCVDADLLEIDDIATYLKSESGWISYVSERIYKTHQVLLTVDEFNEWIETYVLKLRTDGEKSKFKDNAKSHFTNWLLIEIGKKKKDETRPKTNLRTSTKPCFNNYDEAEARHVGGIKSFEF